jgi:hypothetical protein
MRCGGGGVVAYNLGVDLDTSFVAARRKWRIMANLRSHRVVNAVTPSLTVLMFLPALLAVAGSDGSGEPVFR